MVTEPIPTCLVYDAKEVKQSISDLKAKNPTKHAHIDKLVKGLVEEIKAKGTYSWTRCGTREFHTSPNDVDGLLVPPPRTGKLTGIRGDCFLYEVPKKDVPKLPSYLINLYKTYAKRINTPYVRFLVVVALTLNN